MCIARNDRRFELVVEVVVNIPKSVIPEQYCNIAKILKMRSRIYGIVTHLQQESVYDCTEEGIQ